MAPVGIAERSPAPEVAADPERATPQTAGGQSSLAGMVLQLQRSAGNGAVGQLLERRRAIGRLTDQHAGTHLPTADELAKIDTAINPTAPAVKGGVAPKWDGDPSVKDFNNNRAALKAELTASLKAHLDKAMPALKAKESGPKMAMSSFESPRPRGEAPRRPEVQRVDRGGGADGAAGALPQHLRLQVRDAAPRPHQAGGLHSRRRRRRELDRPDRHARLRGVRSATTSTRTAARPRPTGSARRSSRPSSPSGRPTSSSTTSSASPPPATPRC